MRIDVFDRWDAFLFTLGEEDMERCVHTDELNGEDSLDIVTSAPLAKGYRLVWHDRRGRWHEHVADSSSPTESDSAAPVQWTCLNSIVETYGDYIDDLRPNGTAAEAVAKALSPTRWSMGTVDVAGTASCAYYHTSAREALQQAQENWGGELSTTIEVEGDHVKSRKVNLLSRRGADTGKRFVYAKDLQSVVRTVAADDVVTRLYGYGKGEAVESGGYGRRIDFASVNGGKKYVEDTEALKLWGRPDGKGGRKHHESTAVFGDCEDPAELLRLTREELKRLKEPRVSYEAAVVDLEAMGFDHEGCDVGDSVAIIDKAHDPEIRVSGRVTRIERDLLNWEASITVGNIVEGASDLLSQQAAALQGLQNRSANWDVAAYTPSAYINQVMAGLNREFDAGASYIYQSPEQGLIISSVPLDPASGKPKRTPASAIQLKGGGFRIANALKSDGTWDWRTFGTGAGFTADEINAGVIQGGSNYWNLGTGDLLFKQGKITDAKGYTSWNLTNGDFVANNMQANGTFTSRNEQRTIRIANGTIQALDGSGEVVSEIYMDQFGIFFQRSYASGVHIGSFDKANPNRANSIISLMSNGAISIGAKSIVVNKEGWAAEGYDGTVSVGSQSLVFTNGILTGVI